MNSLVVLIAAVACLAQSYAGVYHGAYAHGGLYAGVPHGVLFAAAAPVVAPVAVAPVAAVSVAGGGAYHGPQARPVVLPSGFLADTPEVAAVKGAHLTALATTSAVAAATGAGAYGAGAGSGSASGSQSDGSDDHLWAADGSYRTVGAAAHGAGVYGAGAYGVGAGVYGAGAYGAGAGAASGGRYYGLPAVPVVLPSGYLADTHAVVAARGAHLTAVANAARAVPAANAGVYGAYGVGRYGHGYHY